MGIVYVSCLIYSVSACSVDVCVHTSSMNTCHVSVCTCVCEHT